MQLLRQAESAHEWARGYRSNLEKFLEDKGCVEDGHAAERAVDLIYRILNGDESSTLIGK